LRHLPSIDDPNLLVGINTGDDAAVYRLNNEIAIIQTVDFFPPVVDDPYDYGAIAVANALSDVYAMGGRPLLGLNIVGFPDELDKDILAEILKGGSEKAQEAGVLIVGGHTIDDPEPKYGLSVTGIVIPGHQVANQGAVAGDKLVLTKPLGSGILTTAHKNELLDQDSLKEVVDIMSTLNKNAADAMMQVGAHACTDVTGFGLLGHLKKLLDNSGTGAIITLKDVPVIAAAWDLADSMIIPAGTMKNLMWIENDIVWAPEISDSAKAILADAQTSGGLLISVAPELHQQLLIELEKRDVTGSTIGIVTEETTVSVVSG
jgi:selenide,water dikinase